jgi:hypothetical protein
VIKYRFEKYDQLNNISTLANIEPYEFVKVLGEELDNGGFDCYLTDREPIKQYTLGRLVKLLNGGGQEVLEWFFMSSRIAEINVTNFKHNVSIIELTSLLQQVYFGNATETLPIDDNGNPIITKTMADIVDRVLRIFDTKRSEEVGDLRFILDDTTRTRLESINGREFTFNPTKTLYEVLNQIGKSIQAQVRMGITFDEFGERQYTIKFDFFNDISPEVTGGDYLRHIKSLVETQYHTELVADIQNTYPEEDAKGSKIETVVTTPRSRSGTVVDSTQELVVLLPRNIDTEKTLIVKNVYSFVISAGAVALDPTIPELDITKYLYEKAIYDTLEDGDSFGQKGMSIYYEQYGDKIDGLMYKAPAVFGFLQKEAITKILEHAIEEWVNVNYPAISVSRIDVKTAISDTIFCFEYNPIQNIFTRHTKPLREFDEKTEDTSLVYNQTENIVDTTSVGDAMLQSSARMGNLTYEEEYYFDDYSDLLEVGRFNADGYYITKTKVSGYNQQLLQTVKWVKDYVALEQYIGIDSLNRQYQIPATGDIVERKTHFKEFVDLSFTQVSNSNVALSSFGKFQIGYMFLPVGDIALINLKKPIEAVVLFGLDKIGNPLNVGILTATSVGIGDKLNLSFKAKDNYSLGVSTYAVSGKTQRQQKDFNYTDENGEIQKLQMAFLSGSEFDSYTVSELKEQALAYPRFTKGSVQTENTLVLFLESSSNSKSLWLEKDGRETLNFTYELQFVTEEDEIIIGSYLAENNTLIANNFKQLYVWLCPDKLSKLQRRYVPSNATRISDLDNIQPYGQWALPSAYIKTGVNYTTLPTHKAWCIADEDGKMYLGANQDLNTISVVDNKFQNEIYFNLKRKL